MNIQTLSLRNAFGNAEIIKLRKKLEQEAEEEKLKEKAPECFSRYVEVLEVQAEFGCSHCGRKFWVEFDNERFDEFRKCPNCNKWLKLKS